MGLKSFTAYQPECDVDGCRFVLSGDVDYYYLAPEDAKEPWFDYDGWTDGTTWICENHINEPHAYVDGGVDPGFCDRCQIAQDVHDEDSR